MGDNHDGGPPGLGREQGPEQRGLAIPVEARVRLVEHDHARPAVERPGKPDALALAAGEMAAGLADFGIVALRQGQDHLVHAGGLRGGDHRVRIRIAKPGDVLSHRAGEQLDILRQVADVPADQVDVPGEQVGAVETHAAAGRLPGADQDLAQARFTGGRRPDDAETGARLHREAHAAQHRLDLPGRRIDHLLAAQSTQRRRQAHARGLGRQAREQRAQAVAGIARRDQALPGGDRLLDRGERSPEQDRGGDHATRGQLVLQDEPGADAQDQDLDEHAQELGEADQGRVAVTGLELQGERFLVQRRPAPDEVLPHAHGLDDVGVANRGLDPLHRADRALRRVPQRPPRGRLVDDRERQQSERGADRDQPEQRVHDRDDGDERRRPGRVEQGADARAGEKVADGREIAQRLTAGRFAAQRPAEARADQIGGQPPVEPAAHAAENMAAHGVERAEREQGRRGDQSEENQGLDPPAREHAVVDLPHVQGRGEDQQIDAAAEQDERREARPERARRPVERACLSVSGARHDTDPVRR